MNLTNFLDRNVNMALSFTVKALVAGVLFVPLVTNAYIDERVKEQPAPQALELRYEGISPQTKQAVPMQAEDIVSSSNPNEVGISGDISSSLWSVPYRSSHGQVALADALISLYMPIAGQAITINAQPHWLQIPVRVNEFDTRAQVAQSIANQLSMHIRFTGNEVLLRDIGKPVSATGSCSCD